MCKSITKKELAVLCGVSDYQIRKWCNVDYYQELVKLGYNKLQKMFTPRQTEFLKQNIVEFDDSKL